MGRNTIVHLCLSTAAIKKLTDKNNVFLLVHEQTCFTKAKLRLCFAFFRYFPHFLTALKTKRQTTVKTRDVTRWKHAHTSSEPAGCPRPAYSFHDNGVESFRRNGRLNVIQQEALHRLPWVIPEQALDGNWTYKRSDLHQLIWAVHFKESLLWHQVLKGRSIFNMRHKFTVWSSWSGGICLRLPV